MCTDLAGQQVAVIAGNLELAEIIQNYKPEDIGEFWCSGGVDGDLIERCGINWCLRA